MIKTHLASLPYLWPMQHNSLKGRLDYRKEPLPSSGLKSKLDWTGCKHFLTLKRLGSLPLSGNSAKCRMEGITEAHKELFHSYRNTLYPLLALCIEITIKNTPVMAVRGGK